MSIVTVALKGAKPVHVNGQIYYIILYLSIHACGLCMFLSNVSDKFSSHDIECYIASSMSLTLCLR